MGNENTETIENIVSELKNVKNLIDVGVGDVYTAWRIRCTVCDEYAQRIENAYAREVSSLKMKIAALENELTRMRIIAGEEHGN